MRVLVTRILMATGSGRDMAYDVYVPLAECPKHATGWDANGNAATITQLTRFDGRAGGEFLRYVDATVSAAHRAMPQGGERWDSWKAHEAAALEAELQLIQRAFPETARLTRRPTLWVDTGDGTTGHADVWLEVAL